MKQEKLVNFIFSIQSKPLHRKAFFEVEFLLFMIYYFPLEFSHEIANFQKEYVNSLGLGFDVFIVTFRESAKTTFIIYYYIWCICYRKKRYILHYNSDKIKAEVVLSDVINELTENQKIIQDFGHLYSPQFGRKINDKKKKSMKEFVTENGIKMKAMSLQSSPRGERFKYASVTYRPDLIVFDDIDNHLNINNDELIKRDFIFLTGEVFGGVSSYCQKVFLGNVISDNGRIPMLKKHFESSKNENMKMFWIPIRKKGQITWNRFVATNEEAKKLNKNIKDPKAQYISLEQKRIDQGTIGFNQNFNLIPYKKGSRIIKESDIKHYGTLPNNYKVTFGIDPAFSLKTGSDPIGLGITAQERRDNNIFYYVLELRKFAGEEKEENRFCDVIVDLYHKYSCSMIYIEGNNGGEILARMLKRRGLAVTVISTSKDKVTRVVERQGAFERGDIKFNPDNLKVGEGIEQLINFPNVEHDDIVDGLINSLTPYQGGNIRLI